MDAKTWTAIINEGGEGYNPYTAADDGEPAWSKVESLMAKTQRILNCTSSSDSEYPRLQAKYAALKAAYDDLK
jgi:hypothetical protein